MQNLGQTIQAIPTQLGIFYGQLGMVKQILEKKSASRKCSNKKRKEKREESNASVIKEIK